MLTIQTYKLLRKLRPISQPYVLKYQAESHNPVIVDFNQLKTNKSSYSGTTVIADKHELNYLEDEGYITIYSNNRMIDLTHKGRQIVQISLYQFIIFIAKSVIVPMIVAYLTAKLTI